MTSDILKRAAEAVEGVTPGPWRNEIRYSFIAHDNTWHVLWDVPNSTGVSLVSDTGGNTASCKNDARFIAASRTLIPDMAAAIAERDEQIERLTARAEAAEAMAAIRMKALKVAMMYLTPLQPGDSRAVDDWFVACAAVQCELDDTDGRIEACLDAAMKEGR